MDIGLFSSDTAGHFSTWLCLQLYQPCIRLTLQQTQMCFRFAEDQQRGLVGSSLLWLRFSGEGRTSQVACRRKLICNASMPQSSFQERFCLSTPSNLIHCPYFTWEIAFVSLRVASYQHPRLLIGFSITTGIGSTPMKKLWFDSLHLITDTLLDLLGFIFNILKYINTGKTTAFLSISWVLKY